MHEQDLAVAHREPSESALDVDPIRIGGGGAGLKERRQSHRPKPAGAADVPALVGDDGQEPRTDLGPVAQPGQVAPGLGDRLLGRVLGLGAIAKHRVGQPQPRFDERPDQGLELPLCDSSRIRAHGVDHIIQDTPIGRRVTWPRGGSVE